MPNLLFLEWQHSRIVGVEASVSREGCRVLRKLETEIDGDGDVGPTGQQIKAWLKEAGATSQQAVLVLPRDTVVARRLDVPDAPDEELPNLVRFQAATRLATPVEQLILDFIPLPKTAGHDGRSVLAVTIDQKRMARIRRLCEAAELTPTSIGVSFAGVAEFVVRTSGQTTGTNLIIYQRGTRVEITVLEGLQPVFSHSTVLPDTDGNPHVQPLLAELNRTLVALSHSHPGMESGLVFLVQEGAADAEVQRALGTRFGDRLKQLTTAKSPLASPDGTPLIAPLIGRVLAEQERRVEAIDFLNPRRPPVAKDIRKQRLIIGGAAATGLLILMVGLFWILKSSKQRTIDANRAEIAKIESDLRANKDLLADAEQISEWMAGRVVVTEALTDWHERFPSTERVFLTDLQFTPPGTNTRARITGNGYAKQRRDIERWFEDLTRHGYRVHKPDKDFADKPPDADYPWTFVLDVELPEAVEEDAGAPANVAGL